MSTIHFTGIGGAGMAPLAELTLARNTAVSGSDLELNEKCRRLSDLGARIHAGHAAENLPDDCTLLVYSSAVEPDNCERVRAAALGIPQMRRGEYLAHIAAGFRRCAAISGTHGKSSITALLVSILRACGKDPGFMIGASVQGLPCCSAGDGDIFVTEADESDGTHTLLQNFLAVIPNVEDDHAWSVGGVAALEKNFRTVAANSANVLFYDSGKSVRLFSDFSHAVKLPQAPENFAGLAGFQAVNAFIAWRAAVLLGCDPETAERAAGNYPQVARRMCVHYSADGLTVVEDYAHHPTEVRCALELLRRKYPDTHLQVVFQPHRYARLERYFDEFAAVLREFDSAFILPVFAAWSESGRCDSAMLAAACGGKALDGSWQDAAAKVVSELPRPGVVAVLGAGDCDKILPFLKEIGLSR